MLDDRFPPNEVPADDARELYRAAAAALIEKIRGMRDEIPDVGILSPTSSTQALSTAASIPDEAIEHAASMRERNPELVHGAAASPRTLRELVGYAAAYDVVVYELEGLTQFVRHKAMVARNFAGTEALTTYALVQRLAKRPENAHLIDEAATMRRHLARRFRPPYSKRPKAKE